MSKTPARNIVVLFVLTWPVTGLCQPTWMQEPWVRHTIDDTSQGADGVRLADANGDGLLDVVTPWEEGGVIRVYLNPGADRVTEPWPAVTVGEVGTPEDAVLVDLDDDGAMDVVSCCEGDVRRIYVHWAPCESDQYMNAEAWETVALPAADGVMRWMYCLPLQLDGKHGVDLVAGGKNEGAQLGWFEAPADARDLRAWRWHPMCDVGWVMSIDTQDIDEDGDLDIVASNRMEPNRGTLWLVNPGPGPAQQTRWPRYLIGAHNVEVMFQALADLDGDGRKDVLAAAKRADFVAMLRQPGPDVRWQRYPIAMPEGVGTGKAVAVGDIDGDIAPDVVFSCEHARDKHGVMWFPLGGQGPPRSISGLEGVKFDLVQLIDLDADGDLDVLTCEEATGLGVIWYENPTAP